MFKTEKAAQIAAYFLGHAPCERLKLMKLMYLADRSALELYGFPISGDTMFSLEHGPVLSASLDLISGKASSPKWRKWVLQDDSNVLHSARSQLASEDLDELSFADIEVLESTWKTFGHMTASQLRRYTHDNCAEWEDPGQSRKRIALRDVFIALGQSPSSADEQQRTIESSDALSRRLAKLA